jgi:predicted nucleic acid-binding protein
MSAIYLDSSAFVKLVVREPESLPLRAFLTARSPRRVSSALLRTEAVRAIRHLGPEPLRSMRAALRRIDLVTVDDGLLDAAGLLEPRVLRTLDAIHLATALRLGADLDLVVTYDERMIEGARLLGLAAAAPA